MKIFLPLVLVMALLIGCATPTDSSDFSKRIVGRWLGSRKFEIFYADGIWAVQRNEDAEPDSKGRRWRVEGDKLIRTASFGCWTNTITTLTRTKLVMKDDSYTFVYERYPQ